MNVNMKMSSKIGAAFLTLTALVLISGITGYYGVNKLSWSLEYLTGPAWETADGAMNGTIETQAEMLMVGDVFSGFVDIDDVAEEIKVHSEGAHGALLRVKNGGLLDAVVVENLEKSEKSYEEAAENVLKQFKVFSEINNHLEDNFFEFQLLMIQVEELSDGLFDEDATVSSMLSQIRMLKAMYFYRRMLEFVDLQGSMAGIMENNEMLSMSAEGVIANQIFKKNDVQEGVYQGLSYSSAMEQAVSKHEIDFIKSIEAFQDYSSSREEYERAAEIVLDVLVTTEAIGDKIVETEKEAIAPVIIFVNSMIIFVIIVAVFISMFMGIMILRGVNAQLGRDPAELMEIANSLANGNLDMKIDANAGGVYGSIGQTVNKLLEIISGIKSGAGEVSVASEQVSQGNANLSQRTQEQASSLEEVASSMEEMTSTVNQNSENAQHANQLAMAAREQADMGGKVVGEAVTAMSEINDASKRIADIIGVIDEIAFQTNLLALNAAVEAARAGEQGRGFAVVASEVRNLAGRSATAAKEIKGLIQNSVVKVDNGSKLVSESGGALSEIVDSVKKVSDIVAEIAAASKEQSDGIGQVNTALLQMDEMTQQNASLVEEAAAASEAMGAQAQELDALVSFFKLGKSNYAMQRNATQVRKQTPSHAATPKLSNLAVSESAKKVSLSQKNDDGEWQDF